MEFLERPVHRVSPVELAGAAHQSLAVPPAFKCGLERVAQCSEVVIRMKQTVSSVSDDFWDSTDFGGDNWHAARQRLEQYVGAALGPCWQDEQIGGVVPLSKLCMRPRSH